MEQRKKKLLIVQEAMGGCGRNVIDIVTGIDHDIFDITVLYGDSRIDDYYRNALPHMRKYANIIAIPSMERNLSMKKDVKALLDIYHQIKRIQPDIVHCHSSKAGILGRFAAALRHVEKIFYTPHAYSFQAWEFSETKKRVFAFLERFFSHHFTTCTFNVSKGERDIALQYNIDRPDKLKVVYNGIPDVTLPTREEARAQLALNLPDNAIVVGTTVRLAEQKDPKTFVHIADRVIAKMPKVHFVYVGDGPLMSDVQQYVEAHGLTDNVHLVGYRDDAEFIVSAFDVYLLTSLYEGLPYSLLESLRAGVPLVATDTTGSNEVIQTGINGYLFPIGDAKDGADKLIRLIQEASRGTKFSYETVRDTYLNQFTVEKMLSSIQESYLE